MHLAGPQPRPNKLTHVPRGVQVLPPLHLPYFRALHYPLRYRPGQSLPESTVQDVLYISRRRGI